uniref:MAGE domain-containing protein n=1 Tax=Panagrolaimus superbus TaxID=310955 RepID=A0A914YF87_9BILA
MVITEPAEIKHASVGDAVLAALALSSKGPIKEADLKPLLNRGRFKDWQDGLNDLNAAITHAFGTTLVHDGPSHLFFIRNDLYHIREELTELFLDGSLDGVRIDDGPATINPILDYEEFSEDDKKGLLFALLTSIMMSNNIEMGHKHWLVDDDILHKLCKQMKVSDDIIKKLLSGYNAEFIRSGWIRKVEEKDANQDVNIRYTWGPRAINTISSLTIFKKYCIINKQSELEFGNYLEILKKLDEKCGFSH